MKKFLKDNWKFLLFVLIVGLIGGYFAGIYSYDSLSAEMLHQLEEQNVSKEIVIASTSIQYGLIYGLILAAIGIIVSKKVDLWKKFSYDKKAVIATIIVIVVAALLLFPGDKLFFGPYSSWVNEQYLITPTIAKILTGLLVGGIIEEVMLRLFLMSLIVLIIAKLFYKGVKNISIHVYVIANIISAILFAAGHIPVTMAMTTITPIILVRCFLLNGGIGLAFGYLYRKYGIGYAMIAHGFCHLIADILLILFV